jgi:hypothetical protein
MHLSDNEEVKFDNFQTYMSRVINDSETTTTATATTTTTEQKTPTSVAKTEAVVEEVVNDKVKPRKTKQVVSSSATR